MAHAIVEAIHDLGSYSPFNDGSVRRKELCARIQNARIEVNGQIETGHRSAVFDSALCGRRYTADLFERIEDSNRQGAWWRLAVPYERALEIALGQKSSKTLQTRTRQRQDSSNPKSYLIRPSTQQKCWSRSRLFDSLSKIESFNQKTVALIEKNVHLSERLTQLQDEVAQLKQNATPEVLQMIDFWHNRQNQVAKMRQQLVNVEQQLTNMSKSCAEAGSWMNKKKEYFCSSLLSGEKRPI
jgi:predicted RNase H-like nuclease (RuvC/YqgF family)